MGVEGGGGGLVGVRDMDGETHGLREGYTGGYKGWRHVLQWSCSALYPPS